MGEKKTLGRPRAAYSTKFGKWLNRNNISTEEAMRALGRTDSAIYGLANGQFNPGRELGWKIEEWTKGAVPFDRATWPSCEAK